MAHTSKSKLLVSTYSNPIKTPEEKEQDKRERKKLWARDYRAKKKKLEKHHLEESTSNASKPPQDGTDNTCSFHESFVTAGEEPAVSKSGSPVDAQAPNWTAINNPPKAAALIKTPTEMTIHHEDANYKERPSKSAKIENNSTPTTPSRKPTITFKITLPRVKLVVTPPMADNVEPQIPPGQEIELEESTTLTSKKPCGAKSPPKFKHGLAHLTPFETKQEQMNATKKATKKTTNPVVPKAKQAAQKSTRLVEIPTLSFMQLPTTIASQITTRPTSKRKRDDQIPAFDTNFIFGTLAALLPYDITSFLPNIFANEGNCNLGFLWDHSIVVEDVRSVLGEEFKAYYMEGLRKLYPKVQFPNK